MSEALQVLSRKSSHHKEMKLGMSFMIRDETPVKKAFHQFALEKTTL